MKDEAAIYYPHNVDFRGRAYTMHPHLNHLGADSSRGCLQFAEAKPLGERGMYWLMVHLANKWGKGVDKFPMSERQEWTERNISDIVDSAESPMSGSRRPGQGCFSGGDGRGDFLSCSCEPNARPLEPAQPTQRLRPRGQALAKEWRIRKLPWTLRSFQM